MHDVAPPGESARKAALRAGFTLIEISIVLVIIGLIVAGIVVGQELIRQATLRQVITQEQKFQAAVNTFYGKYQALPGDLPSATATSLGLSSYSTYGVSDPSCENNGLIDDQYCHSSPYFLSGEVSMFWVNLSTDTHLVPGAYTYYTYQNVASGMIAGSFPTFPAGTAYWVAEQDGAGQNWLTTALNCCPTGTNSSSNAAFYSTTALSFINPLDAYFIDAKIDDGMPNTGGVQLAAPGGDGAGGTNVASPTLYWFSGCSWDGSAANTPAATYQKQPISNGGACNLRFMMK